MLISNAASRRRGRDYRCAAALAACLAACTSALWAPRRAAAKPGAESAIVRVVFVPTGTGPGALAARGLSPGLMSAGLSEVPAEQTYLDVGQGNRVFDALYDRELPPLRTVDGKLPRASWRAVVERARSAPADIVPGLLATTLKRAGHFATASNAAGRAGLVAVDRGGRVDRRAACPASGCVGIRVSADEAARLARIARGLSGDDLLIAMERPPPPGEGDQLSIGIAGRGFDGQLSSDSTRIDGLVLSTDLAPTVLERAGAPVPDAISGDAIRAEGSTDPARLASLEDRMGEIGPRRGPVIGVSVLVWVVAAAVASAALRARGARIALPLLGLSGIYLPAVLLVGAAIEPSQAAERLLVLAGCPILAAATLLVARGYAAAAIACAVTVLAYAIDVVAGSPLTALSLIGPNPGLGVRFFGIGNELEAAVAALVPIGVGAGLTAAGIGSGRRAAVAFGAAALVGVLVFAPGRFGADAGAAVVLPVGAAVGAWAVLGGGRRTLLLVLALPLLALAAVVAIDLVLGGDAHLSRSVLQAGGLDELGEVVERRVRLSADSFKRNLDSPSMFACAALIVAGLVLRTRIASWFEERPAALAGLLGAIAATAVGTLANDSGALVLTIGTGFVSLFVAFAYGQHVVTIARCASRSSPPIPGPTRGA